MGNIERASFDPIFWSHDANVDRFWAQWQRSALGEDPAADLMNRSFANRGYPAWRVRDTLNTLSERLDYTYEGMEAVPVTAGAGLRSQGFARMAASPAAKIATTPMTVLKIKDVCIDGESLSCDVFIADGGGSKQPEEKDFIFAGFLRIFGMNGHGMAPQPDDDGHPHGQEHDHGGGHCITQYVDITDAVEQLDLRRKLIAIKILAANASGDEIEAGRLPIGDIQTVLEWLVGGLQ